MAASYNVKPGKITVSARNIDDQANFWIDRDKTWIGNGGSETRTVNITNGDTVNLAFEVYNMTGGKWNAVFTVSSPDGMIWHQEPSGFTAPGVNIVYHEEITLVGRA